MFFVLSSCFLMFKKKLDRGWVDFVQSEFFSDFWICFNLTRALSRSKHVRIYCD